MFGVLEGAMRMALLSLTRGQFSSAELVEALRRELSTPLDQDPSMTENDARKVAQLLWEHRIIGIVKAGINGRTKLEYCDSIANAGMGRPNGNYCLHPIAEAMFRV
jgi:hypothetical protein